MTAQAPAQPSPLQVWKDHQVVGTFPPDSGTSVDATRQLTVTPSGGAAPVSFSAGQWDAFAIGAACGWSTPSPTCANCHPPDPSPPPSRPATLHPVTIDAGQSAPPPLGRVVP
jgi:hypothetical protein